MLNPIALWKALRHFSLTFAVIFASTLLGASITALLTKLLGKLSLPWLVLWLAPMIIVAMVANREKRWLPDESLRRRVARRIVLGSIALWVGMFVLRTWISPPAPEPEPAAPPATRPSPTRRGPAGK